MKQVTKHLRHYLPLFGILLAGVFGMMIFSFDRNFQLSIIIATSLGYLFWGVVHHHLHKDLTFAVFMEYLAIAVPGGVIVISILTRV